MTMQSAYRRSRVFLGLLAAGAVAAGAAIPIMGLYQSLDVFSRQDGLWKPDTLLALLHLYALIAAFSIPLTLMLGATIFALLIRWVALTPRHCAAAGGLLVPLPFAGFPDMGSPAGMVTLAFIALFGAAAGLTFWRAVRVRPADQPAGLSEQSQ
jgi:hypothetical protein